MGALGMSPLGIQALGTVDAVGPEAVGFAPGDRVAMREPSDRPGFQRIVSERDLIGLPKDVSFDDAAAVLATGLVARVIVKQIRPVGRGDRVIIRHDDFGIDTFVEAWARHLGATVVDETDGIGGEIVIGAGEYLAGRRWRYGYGLAQLAAADVFQALRDGAFDNVPVPRHPISDAVRVHSDIESKRNPGPVVLLPGFGVGLAA
ncbi:hypothetical protein [Glaciihabitans sp. dw_435]|uniref:hypothetical protein n=1 Tax=Glaciihabitans sp. dw_435 TaxID=2720081 RepID=UPI001BD46B16|nr:hypothetical protein [Glaciihabitans sp. dw_435]